MSTLCPTSAGILAARTARIRALNDTVRTTLTGGRIIATRSIADDAELQTALLAAIQAFTAFTEDNDPDGEHDFGSIEHSGETYFWKIDYYDLADDALSEDPADPQVTNRVLTVMHASEY